MNINSWNNEFILGWLLKSHRHKNSEINNTSDDDIDQLKITQTKPAKLNVSKPDTDQMKVSQMNITRIRVGQPNIDQLNIDQPNIDQPNIDQPKYNLRDDIQPEVSPVVVENDLEQPIKKKNYIGSISVSKYTLNVIKCIIIFSICICVLFLSFHNNDLTQYVSTEDQFLSKAGRDHILYVQLDGTIPQYSDGAAIDVYGYNGVYTIYLDGEYEGVHITDANYSIFKIKIGSNYYLENSQMSYEYDYKEWVGSFDDSTRCVFLANKTNNDCLFICMDRINDKIVSVTYYKDSTKAAKALDF